MALDPKELYSEGWWDEKTPTLPPGVTPPSGVDWSTGNYYAHFRINKDGSREIQWYQRGVGGGAGKSDPVMETTSDQLPAGSEVVKAWEAAQAKERAEGRAGDQEGDTRGPQNGPQREVYRKGKWITEDNPLYQANQTGTTGSNPRVPAGSVPRIEGTPIPGQPGQFDNSQPIRAWHTPDGKVIYEPLAPTDADYLQWQRDQNGGLTNTERQQQQQKDDTTVTDVAYTGTGKNRVKVTTYKSGRKATEAAPTNATATATTYETRGGKPVKVTKYDDGTETVEEQQPKPGQIQKGGGPNGEDVQAVVAPDGTISYQPIAGAQTPSANRSIPANAPKYVPDYSQDDMGLTAYNEALLEWVNKGGGNRDMGRQLLEQAGALAQTSQAHGTQLRTQASTTRNQDITQRAQDIGEVQSRRSAANQGFDTLWGDVSGNARYLGAGGGDVASQALFDALAARQAYAAQAGGYADVPQVPVSPALGAGRQTTIHPDGTIQIAHPATGNAMGAVANGVTATTAAATNPTGANVQAANDATMAGSQAAFGAAGVPPQQPAAGPTFGGPNGGFMPPAQMAAPDAPATIFDREARAPAYLGGGAPQWAPDNVVASLKQQGFTDQEIAQALDEHHRGYNAA